MTVFYLISIILGLSVQNITRKAFTEKNSGNGVYFFAVLSAVATMLFFVFTSGGLKWDSGIIVYALFFALLYACAMIFSVLAVAYGSLSLTTLINSFSLMLPTLYGLVFLGEPMGWGFIPGILLLALSLVLINQKSESSSLTLKWGIFVVLAFIGNGMCSIVQKMQQNAFDGAYKSEFMIISLAIVVAVVGIFSLKNEAKNAKTYLKTGWHLALLCGIMNGVVNLFVMVLSAIMPVSLMFPIISAGGVVLTYFVARFYYKEELGTRKFLGFLVGIISVIFLNI